MDDNYDDTIRKLRDQVGKLASVPSTKSSFIRTNWLRSNLLYVTVPIAVLIILLIWRPNFVLVEESVNGSLPTMKLSYKKLLLWSLVFTALIEAGIIYYNKQKVAYM